MPVLIFEFHPDFTRLICQDCFSVPVSVKPDEQGLKHSRFAEGVLTGEKYPWGIIRKPAGTRVSDPVVISDLNICDCSSGEALVSTRPGDVSFVVIFFSPKRGGNNLKPGDCSLGFCFFSNSSQESQWSRSSDSNAGLIHGSGPVFQCQVGTDLLIFQSDIHPVAILIPVIPKRDRNADSIHSDRRETGTAAGCRW